MKTPVQNAVKNDDIHRKSQEKNVCLSQIDGKKRTKIAQMNGKS